MPRHRVNVGQMEIAPVHTLAGHLPLWPPLRLPPPPVMNDVMLEGRGTPKRLPLFSQFPANPEKVAPGLSDHIVPLYPPLTLSPSLTSSMPRLDGAPLFHSISKFQQVQGDRGRTAICIARSSYRYVTFQHIRKQV
jgi:hypothetical protein